MPDYILNPNQVALLEAAANSKPVPSPVADDPAYKYGLLLGALDELIERWSKASVTYSDSREGAMLGVALGELRGVVRIHG